jgi:hypothetical protein
VRWFLFDGEPALLFDRRARSLDCVLERGRPLEPGPLR